MTFSSRDIYWIYFLITTGNFFSAGLWRKSCHKYATTSINASIQMGFMEDGCRQLFDALAGGIEE
jgi:hypothetical protein